jgi:hypothetical protein
VVDRETGAGHQHNPISTPHIASGVHWPHKLPPTACNPHPSIPLQNLALNYGSAKEGNLQTRTDP